MFASYASAGNHHGAGRDAVWCKADAVTQDLLLAQAPEIYFSPPYVGSSGWIGIHLDGKPDWTAVTERLEHAHRFALGPAKNAARLVRKHPHGAGSTAQSRRRRLGHPVARLVVGVRAPTGGRRPARDVRGLEPG